VEGILEKAQENMNSIMPLYTHLQQAQIGNLSHYFLSYSEQLFRDLERLYNAYTKINKSPLGAGPIGGSSLPVDRERTALLLGFEGLVTNSIDATSSRDSIVEVLSALSILMITLSRIAEDFIIWSTQEFGYLEIADNFASTSSAMPHKKNPDPLELIRSKAAIVCGNLMTSLMILRGLPSGYNRDLQDLKKVLFDSLSLVYDSLGMIDAIVRTIIIHDRRMNQAVIDSFANSIDIAEQLVVKYGLSFRTAHRLVGSMVRLALDKKGLSLSSLSQDDIEHVIVGKSNELKAEEVLNILQDTDPKEMLLSRAVQGSPNPRMQKAAIKISRIRLQKYMDKLIVRKKLLKTSLDTLTRVSCLYLNKK
jgi:argininosuccinate lyase